MSLKITKTIRANTEPTKKTKVANPYEPSIELIKQAIESLGDVASAGDECAKEAIANLSVIMFELQ